MKALLLVFIFTTSLLFGANLRELLELTKHNNELLQASQSEVEAKKSALEATQSSFYPTLDLSAFYMRDDDATPFLPGTTYGARAQISWDIYDGGKRSYEKSSSKEELLASSAAREKTYKELSLEVTKAFFNIKSLQAALTAQEDAKRALKAQLERTRSFYKANLATSDAVDRLQAAYDKLRFSIESTRFKILSLQKGLSLLTGTRVTKLEKSAFVKVKLAHSEELDALKVIRHNAQALSYKSQSVTSYYMPHLRIVDHYSVYGYKDEPVIALPGFTPIPVEYLPNQNHIEATLTLRLFDFGTLRQKSQALRLEAQALQQKLQYGQKEQHMQQELAVERIKTARLRLQSAKSAFKAASSALHTITQKYESGIVDNVTYLDALKTRTEAKAALQKAKNDLEIAYAIYYYYNAKNLQEYLQ